MKCFWGHAWDNWQEEETWDITRGLNADGSSKIIGHIYVMKRKCKRCDLIQRKKKELRI